jgi:hypothetical protein
MIYRPCIQIAGFGVVTLRSLVDGYQRFWVSSASSALMMKTGLFEMLAHIHKSLFDIIQQTTI